MNTDVIVAKIEEEARIQAAEILKEAKEKMTAAKDASTQKIAQDKEKTLKQAKEEGVALEERMLRMAQLEQGKELLLLKQKIMDEAFEKALEKMQKYSKEQLESFFITLVVEAAQGNETLLLGERQKDWFEESFVSKANKLCVEKGKPGQLRLGVKLYPNGTGIVLKDEGTLVHCTLESILSAQRMDLEAAVAEILFS